MKAFSMTPSGKTLPKTTARTTARTMLRTTLRTTGHNPTRTRAGIAACTLIVAAAMGLHPGENALAQEGDAKTDGFYVRATGGLNILSSGGYEVETADGTANTSDADYQTGYAFGGSAGYEWANGLALEGEIMYRRNDYNGFEATGLGTVASGDLASLSLMGNVIYAFPGLGGNGRLRPYIGAGAGIVQEIDTDITLDNGDTLTLSGDGFAWQAMAGLRWQFSRRWRARVEARYFDGSDAALTADAATLRPDYTPLSVLLSLGYGF